MGNDHLAVSKRFQNVRELFEELWRKWCQEKNAICNITVIFEQKGRGFLSSALVVESVYSKCGEKTARFFGKISRRQAAVIGD